MPFGAQNNVQERCHEIAMIEVQGMSQCLWVTGRNMLCMSRL